MSKRWDTGNDVWWQNVYRWQSVTGVTVCEVLAKTHALNHSRPRPELITRYLTSAWCIMWCRYLCCCWLRMCVCLAVFVQLSASACLLSGAFLLLSGSSFQDGQWVSWQLPPPLPPSSYWETMGGLLQGHEEAVCVVMRGIYWGSSGLPFRKLQLYPSRREAFVCVSVFLCLLGLNLLTRIKSWKKSHSTRD